MIRVRFAPSPTGHLHVGGLRAALFNWLFARHNNGKFLLRIEDTDTERSEKRYLDSILSSLKWCKIDHDEPLVIQSERLDLYRTMAYDLLAQGKAYRCYCTPQELEQRLGANATEGTGYTKYDGRCRTITEIRNQPFCLRFKLPENLSTIRVDDIIKGPIEFPADQFDDFIIVRTDGGIMYNFGVVIDDAAMKITHIIRGEEHLVNTPKQILLYQAFDYELPQFGHTPLILGPDGSKLSKRDAATAVIDYKDAGYLPDALCNYLVRLGWSHGDQEIFTREELIKLFSLETIGSKGSIFDIQKLAWVNSVYIKNSSIQELIKSLSENDPLLMDHLSSWSSLQIETAIAMFRDRVTTLKEMRDALIVLHDGPVSYEDHETVTLSTPAMLSDLLNDLNNKRFDRDTLQTGLKTLAKNHNVNFAFVAQPIRIALTGVSAMPAVYDLLLLLGKETTIFRIKKFLEYLNKKN
jgi:glutamyl-tRNA synthetase